MSGRENYRRTEGGVGAEACISGFGGLCPCSSGVATGGLQAGIGSEAEDTTAGDDSDHQAWPL